VPPRTSGTWPRSRRPSTPGSTGERRGRDRSARGARRDPVDADRATSTTYFHAQHVRHGTAGGDLLVIAGTYLDRLTCDDGRWQIVERTQRYTWRDGNPAVTLGTPPAGRTG
jgi:hypothetical protein